MELGFLGLGQMGAAIAERLEQVGAKLHVFDPSARPSRPSSRGCGLAWLGA